MIPGPPRKGISARARTPAPHPSQSPPTQPPILAFPTANPSRLVRLSSTASRAARQAAAIGCSCSRGPGSPPGALSLSLSLSLVDSLNLFPSHRSFCSASASIRSFWPFPLLRVRGNLGGVGFRRWRFEILREGVGRDSWESWHAVPQLRSRCSSEIAGARSMNFFWSLIAGL